MTAFEIIQEIKVYQRRLDNLQAQHLLAPINTDYEKSLERKITSLQAELAAKHGN